MIKEVAFLLSLACLPVLGEIAPAEKKQTEPLSLNTILMKTRENTPQIEMALKKIEKSQFKVTEKEGSFDAKLVGSHYNRRKGYYPGRHTEGKIEKPIPFANSKVYGGYRKSSGSFPAYEGDKLTLEDGEIMAGVSLSLFRNFGIDKKRLDLQLAELDYSNSIIQKKITFQETQKEASYAYWIWVAAGHQLRVAKDLYELSIKRQDGFEKRIKKGDLAALYGVENKQYILKRLSKVQKAQSEFESASFYLSLFYRDDKGNPIEPTEAQLPELSFLYQLDTPLIESDDEVLQRNLLVSDIENNISKIQSQDNFYSSRYMPDLSLKYEVLKDRGEGPKNLQGPDHKLVLNLEIPLEYNKISGGVNANRKELEILKYKLRFLKDKLLTKNNQLKVKMSATKSIIQNTTEEVDLSLTLESGEKKKFDSGGSDFFVINIREQNTFDARQRLIDAHLEYKLLIASFKELLFDYPVL